MKGNKVLGGIFLAALGLGSCSEETFEPTPSDNQVRLHASVAGSGETRIGDSWTGTERIGVYMIAESGFQVVGEVENKEYKVAQGTKAVMTPIDSEASYPTDGSKVRFIGYYPYSDAVDEGIYRINLSGTGVDHDLLYSKTETTFDHNQAESVHLSFYHQLAKLILNVKVESENADDPEIILDASNWSASVNRNTTANFNLAEGTLGDRSTQKYYAMDIMGATASAIVMPGREGLVTIHYDGKEYDWNTEEVDFIGGTQYTYTITIKPSSTEEPDPVVKVRLESSINDWNKVDGGNIELGNGSGNGGDNGGEEENAPVYTSNIDIANLTIATDATSVTLNIEDQTYPGIKFGTSSKTGSWTSPGIGEGKTKLSLYALAWKDKTTEYVLTINGAGTFKDGSTTLSILAKSNIGITANSPFTVTVSDTDLYEFELEGVSDETTLTVATTNSKEPRGVIFGLNAN